MKFTYDITLSAEGLDKVMIQKRECKKSMYNINVCM